MAKPVVVTVREAPESNRPPEYTGAIGVFTLSADLAPVTARVGDPLTLTLKLKGEGTLDRTRAPDLESMPGHRRALQGLRGHGRNPREHRTFTYSLRPLLATIEEFPTLSMAYFDVDKERYVLLRTDPIPLSITEADRLDTDEIVHGGGSEKDPPSTIESRKEGIFANTTDPSALRDQRISPAICMLLLAGMVVLHIVSAYLVTKFAEWPEIMP